MSDDVLFSRVPQGTGFGGWGKCDSRVETTVPYECREALAAKAAAAGLELSAFVRMALLATVYGAEEVNRRTMEHLRATLSTMGFSRGDSGK